MTDPPTIERYHNNFHICSTYTKLTLPLHYWKMQMQHNKDLSNILVEQTIVHIFWFQHVSLQYSIHYIYLHIALQIQP